MPIITKAIIAAAGRGTRFLPIVKAYPKELLPLLSKPNIQLLVEEAIGAGITDIMIVQREGETAIEKYFTPDSDLETYLNQTNKTEFLDSLRQIWNQAKVQFTFQSSDLPYGNASPALAAKSFVGSDPFIYMFGDDLAIESKPGTYLSQIIKTFTDNQADAVAAVQQVPWDEISRYGSILFDKNEKERIRGVFEKVPREQAPSNYTQWGRFAVTSKIIQNLETQTTSQGELWWADAISHLSQTGKVLSVESPTDLWMTTGDPLRWLKANIALGLMDPQLAPQLRQYLDNIK